MFRLNTQLVPVLAAVGSGDMKPVDNQDEANGESVGGIDLPLRNEGQVVRVLIRGDLEEEEESEDSTRLEPELIKHKLRSKDIDAFKALEQEGADQIRAELHDFDEEWSSGVQKVAGGDPSRWLFFAGLVILGAVLVSAYFRSSEGSLEKEEEAFLNRVNQQAPVDYGSTSQDQALADITQLIDNYAAADSWEQRLPMLRRSPGLEGRIRRFEANVEPGVFSQTVDHVSVVEFPDDFIDPNVFPIVFLDKVGRRKLLYCIEVDGEWKVDWDATEGQQVVDIDSLGEGHIGQRVIMRALLSFDSLYLEQFPEKKYLSIRLLLPRDERAVYGFVERGAPQSFWLESTKVLEKDIGKKIAVLVEVELKSKVAGRWVVELTQLINNNWVAPDNLTVGTLGEADVE